MRLMTGWGVLVGVLVLTVGLAACAEDDETPTSPTPPPVTTPPPTPPPPAPTPTTASLSGTVSNSTGARIAGAKITVLDGPLAGASTTTNANGEWRFDVLTIANANFGATFGGYNEVRAGTHVDGNNSINFVFTRARLAGTVMNTDGNRVGGATVTVLDGPNAGQSVDADGSGDYNFPSLFIANANLSANAGGHDEARGGTFINGSNRVDFTLQVIPEESEEENPIGADITITADPRGNRSFEFQANSTSDFGSHAYSWNWGDGHIEHNEPQRVIHTFEQPGTYTIVVTARAAGEETDRVGTLTLDVD